MPRVPRQHFSCGVLPAVPSVYRARQSATRSSRPAARLYHTSNRRVATWVIPNPRPPSAVPLYTTPPPWRSAPCLPLTNYLHPTTHPPSLSHLKPHKQPPSLPSPSASLPQIILRRRHPYTYQPSSVSPRSIYLPPSRRSTPLPHNIVASPTSLHHRRRSSEPSTIVKFPAYLLSDHHQHSLRVAISHTEQSVVPDPHYWRITSIVLFSLIFDSDHYMKVGLTIPDFCTDIICTSNIHLLSPTPEIVRLGLFGITGSIPVILSHSILPGISGSKHRNEQ